MGRCANPGARDTELSALLVALRLTSFHAGTVQYMYMLRGRPSEPLSRWLRLGVIPHSADAVIMYNTIPYLVGRFSGVQWDGVGNAGELVFTMAVGRMAVSVSSTFQNA